MCQINKLAAWTSFELSHPCTGSFLDVLTEVICYLGDYEEQSLSKPPIKETFL